MDTTDKQIKTGMRENREIWESPPTPERLPAVLAEQETLFNALFNALFNDPDRG
ncbi:hypothetical protein [Kamptonema formosum]|uniref:hypothetical protein n=1 Tax=Kamptonema formosum TaxID=331992 RepID=UPI000348567D|nr:hypothetical protein [Oscillatoria sp. PCC 10802]